MGSFKILRFSDSSKLSDSLKFSDSSKHSKYQYKIKILKIFFKEKVIYAGKERTNIQSNVVHYSVYIQWKLYNLSFRA